MKTIRFIGDCHGMFEEYYEIAKDCEYSIQLGDFGFGAAHQKLLYSDLNPVNHKFICGNHDDMDIARNSPFNLGNHGIVHDEIFFVRGALSPDSKFRVARKLPWWSSEELNFSEMFHCIFHWLSFEKNIIIAHTAPTIMREVLGKNDDCFWHKFGYEKDFVENTTLLLDNMFAHKKPKLFICGHYHTSFDKVVDGTRFICLNELEYLDIDIGEYTDEFSG